MTECRIQVPHNRPRELVQLMYHLNEWHFNFTLENQIDHWAIIVKY